MRRSTNGRMKSARDPKRRALPFPCFFLFLSTKKSRVISPPAGPNNHQNPQNFSETPRGSSPSLSLARPVKPLLSSVPLSVNSIAARAGHRLSPRLFPASQRTAPRHKNSTSPLPLAAAARALLPSRCLPLPLIPGIALCCGGPAPRPTPPTASEQASPAREAQSWGNTCARARCPGRWPSWRSPAARSRRPHPLTHARDAAGAEAAREGEAEETGEYLELRSRRLEKPPQAPLKEAAHATRRVAGRKAAAAAAVDEDDVEVSFGENVLDFEAMERSTRETTPCSLIRNSETVSTPGSTTKSKTSSSMTSRRRMEASVCRFIPSSLEMEEFFAAAEQQEQHAFREKYNFCPVNDCPLPGRYEWARLDC